MRGHTLPDAIAATFENFPVFNLIGTGPTTRLPKGFSCLVSKQTELQSKLIAEPSKLTSFVLVFIINAFKTSPF